MHPRITWLFSSIMLKMIDTKDMKNYKNCLAYKLHKFLTVFFADILPTCLKMQQFIIKCEILEQWKKRKTGCLGYVGGIVLPSYVGIIMNHYYKDPY